MIDKDKTYRTRDGREVRIYATDGEPVYPIHGAIKNSDGWMNYSWHESGLAGDANLKSDLIEVKSRIKREYWVNVYPEEWRHNSLLHTTKDSAEALKSLDRIACVKVVIDCEEGDGL